MSLGGRIALVDPRWADSVGVMDFRRNVGCGPEECQQHLKMHRFFFEGMWDVVPRTEG